MWIGVGVSKAAPSDATFPFLVLVGELLGDFSFVASAWSASARHKSVAGLVVVVSRVWSSAVGHADPDVLPPTPTGSTTLLEPLDVDAVVRN